MNSGTGTKTTAAGLLAIGLAVLKFFSSAAPVQERLTAASTEIAIGAGLIVARDNKSGGGS